jgi:tetratricopeptide (TPR) repeat protein
VLQQQPQSASALTGLANLALKAGAEEEAVSYLTKAVTVVPTAFEPRFLLGSAYNRLERYQEAVAEFEAAIRLGGEGPEVQYQLARAYGGLGRQEDRRKALARFNELTNQAKSDVEGQRRAHRLMESARTAVAEGRLNTAADEFEQARQLRPKDDTVLYQLAAVYFDLGRYDSAAESVQAAIQIAPSRWLYHYLLANIALKTRQWEQAKSSLVVALKLNPTAAEAHNAFGKLALELNDRKTAIAAFERATQLDPKEPAYRMNLESVR